MPKFFVGQRVRILWSIGWPELKGQEGKIVATDELIENKNSPLYGQVGYEVAPDCWGSSAAPRISSNGGYLFTPTATQLEPILPEGHKAGDFSYKELLEHLKDTVYEKA